jgi:signal transduction histidine kinase
LKNPISAIINTTALIEDYYEKMEPSAVKKNLQNIANSADHLFKLFDNLLQWSKNSVGEIDYHPNIHNISDLIFDATQYLKQQAKFKNIKLNYKISQGMKNVVCDENMIKSVVVNIVSNAIKYSHRDDEVDISVDIYPKDKHYILVSVKDSGVGISPETLNTIFNAPVISSTQGTDAEYGFGLGLVLSKEFVKKHNCEL